MVFSLQFASPVIDLWKRPQCKQMNLSQLGHSKKESGNGDFEEGKLILTLYAESLSHPLLRSWLKEHLVRG